MNRNNTILRAFGEVWNVSKSLFCWNYALTLTQGITNAVPIIALQVFMDQIAAVSGNNTDWWTVIAALLLFLSMKTISHVIKGVTDYNYEYYDLKVSHAVTYKTNRKVSLLAALFFEEKENLDSVEKGYAGTRQVRRVVDTTMMILLYYIPEVLVIAYYLYQANPFLPFIIPIILVAIIAVERIQEKYYSNLEAATANLTRKIEVYGDYVSDLKHYKETAMLGLQPYFSDKVQQCLQDRSRVRWECFCKSNKLELLEKAVTLLGHILVLGLLFLCVLNGGTTVGVFAALVTSIDSLFEMIDGLVGELSSGFTEIMGKVKNYLAIHDMQRKDQNTTTDETLESISFDRVSFCYPNQTTPALQNISLTINKGEHIAVVGENGAGKSTLVKLLSGIYEPTQGRVVIKGEHCPGQSIPSFRNKISAVFQNYGRYQMSIADNVKIGDINKGSDVTETLNRVGLVVSGDSGLTENTLLSREFGGVELSGGQWQRLAIARGFYRQSDWVFLDEPTSAIDPNEEGELFRLFHELTQDKTSVIVTHRLGSIKYADKVLVVSNGEIAGFDTHDTLLKNCKEYRRIWESQSEMYV